jgi:hypothetical protein
MMLHAFRLALPLDAHSIHAEAPDPFGVYLAPDTPAPSPAVDDSYPQFADHRCAQYRAAGVLPWAVHTGPGV